MSKPTRTPAWATSLTNRTEPPAGVKAAGFLVNEKLPAQYFNDIVGLISDWWTWVTSYVSFDADAVNVTGDVTATGEILAGTYMKPTSAANVLISATADPEVAFTNLGNTVNIPVRCGVGTLDTHAMTPAWVHRCSVIVDNLSCTTDTERDIDFASSEYLSHAQMWEIAHANRLVAPDAGYYHIDLYADFGVSGGANMERQYIKLLHSGDSRVLTAASTVTDQSGTGALGLGIGNQLSCSIDCYLGAAQYVYGRIYQKSGSSPHQVDLRATMHRIG